MRLLSVCLFALALALTAVSAADAQWAVPSGVITTPAEAAPAGAMDIVPHPRVTWIDLSGGVVGVIVGIIIAGVICNDDDGRRCPAAGPVIGGAVGGIIGIAVGRAITK